MLMADQVANIMKEGLVLLQSTISGLSESNYVCLQRMLAWILCSPEPISITCLEQIISFELKQEDQLSVDQRIATYFDQSICVDGEIVSVVPQVEAVLRNKSFTGDLSLRGTEQKRLVLLSMSHRDVPQQNFTQIVPDVQEQAHSKTLGSLLERTGHPYRQMIFSEQDALVSILRSVFELFDYGLSSKTTRFLSHAVDALPHYLLKLMNPDFVGALSTEEQVMIGDGLSTFLEQPSHFDQMKAEYGPGTWLKDRKLVEAVHFWYKKPEIRSRDEIYSTTVSGGRPLPVYAMFDTVAQSVGQRWLNQYRVVWSDLDAWLLNYVQALDQEQQSRQVVAGATDRATDKVDANVGSDGSDAVMTVQHIERIAVWASSHCDIAEDDCYHLSLGNTFLLRGWSAEALKCFHAVGGSSSLALFSLIGIAQAYLDLQDSESCLQAADRAYSMFLSDKSKLAQLCRDAGSIEEDGLQVTTAKLATIFLQFCEWQKAFQLYSMSNEHGDWKNWMLVYIGAMAEDETLQSQAADVLVQWQESAGQEGYAGPAEYLLRRAGLGGWEKEIYPMIRSVCNDNLRALLLVVLKDALSLSKDTDVHAVLLDLQGIGSA